MLYGKETFHDSPPQGEVIWGKKGKIDVFFKKSSSLLPGMFQTNYIYSNDDKGRVYQLKFEISWSTGEGFLVLGRGHISHIVKMHYFFKNFFLYTQL